MPRPTRATDPRLWALLPLLLLPREGLGSGLLSLERGHPVGIEDAYPVPYRGVELELTGVADGLGEVASGAIAPELKVGLFRNGHVFAGGTVRSGPLNGNLLQAGALVNLNAETPALPAFALAAVADWRTGGVGTLGLRALATRSEGPLRLHLNGEARMVARRSPNGIADYRLGLGADHLLGLTTLLAAAATLECPQRLGGQPDGVFELGLRQQLDPGNVISAGVGVRYTEDPGNPRVHANAGWSWTF